MLSVLLAAVAQAAPRKPAPAHDPKQEKAARTHFDRAEKAFNLGDFEAALSGYKDAYEVLPLPAFLFNIAQCHRNLRNREQAVFFYQRYLSLAPDAPNRPVVEELIAEQKRLQAKEAAAQQEEEPDEKGERSVNLAAPPEKLDPAVARLGAQPAEPRKTRWERSRWWVLGAAGAVLVGGALILVGRSGGSLPQGSLGSIDTR